MAVPTDYVFSSGTCLKSQIYQLIIDKLVAAGWTDTSSLASSDFVVLKSTGNNGDKNLILNIRDTNASAANSVVSTDYCVMSYRLQDTYTPGTTGVAGTFGRSSLAWTALYLAPVSALTTTLAAATPINYKVYADASKIILLLEYPYATGYSPTLIYMGQPDTVYVTESNNRGCLTGTTNNGTTASSVMICNTSDDQASATAPYAIATSALLPSKNPNGAGKYAVSEIYYGSTTESIRGKLDGVLCAYNSNLLTGDQITIGTYTYYVAVCASVNVLSFPSLALLVRIA
ncbi:hypothetical protein [Sporomusa aerivorans]|uniref:hypothetical protein n=1 Tax=Sporomusa aerivorans TaxID=204936 RepID=UPI003529F699